MTLKQSVKELMQKVASLEARLLQLEGAPTQSAPDDLVFNTNVWDEATIGPLNKEEAKILWEEMGHKGVLNLAWTMYYFPASKIGIPYVRTLFECLQKRRSDPDFIIPENLWSKLRWLYPTEND